MGSTSRLATREQILRLFNAGGLLHTETLPVSGTDLKTMDMAFEERLGLLLDREQAVRETRRMKTRLRKAKLRQQGSVEDIDFRHPRGLDKSLVVRLADCQWIKKHNNLIITGPTGVDKSYLACAFAEKACREAFSALYLRTTKLFENLSLAKGDGRYLKLLTSYAKTPYPLSDYPGNNCQALQQLFHKRFALPQDHPQHL